MIEQAILGIIQGIAEWLPVSSEGIIILSKKHLFNSQDTFSMAVDQALFLHFGTFLAALVYFHKDVAQILKTLFSYKAQPVEDQKLINFLALATIISGLLGITLIKIVDNLTTQLDPHGQPVTGLIGLLLIGTGLLELRAKKGGYKNTSDLKTIDGIILGIVQGFAALPGFSRSGLTMSALLLRKFDKTNALRLSFLMSMPIVLAGNIVLHFNLSSWTVESLVGLTFAFIFGLLTIHLLLKVAQLVNFGLFVLSFGILTILSTFI